MSGSTAGRFRLDMQQDVAQTHACNEVSLNRTLFRCGWFLTCPVGARGHSWTPVEANRLLHHVRLFAPVSCACQRDGNRRAWKLQNVVHRHRCGPADESLDVDAMALPLELRHCAMISHVVQGYGCDESGFGELV